MRRLSRLLPPAILRGPLGLPLAAAVIALTFVVLRFFRGNPLSSSGGDLVYVHHIARLRVAEAWQDLLDGQISWLQFLQMSDGEFPPFLHLFTLLLGTVFGHSAEVAILSGLLWLGLLALSVGWITLLLTRVASLHLAPSKRAHLRAGSLAATVILLMGSFQAFSLRYYYDLPMTALLWGGLALVTLFWDRRPVLAGMVAGVAVAAAALTKWTALPFAACMAFGLIFTTLHLPATPGVRRKRLASLAVASAVTLIVCGTWLEIVDEGQAQSSLSVMGGTFHSRSGKVITGSDLKASLDSLSAEEIDAFGLHWTSPQMGNSSALHSGDIDKDGVQELVVYEHDGRVRLYRKQRNWTRKAEVLALDEVWRAPPRRPTGPEFFDWTGEGNLQPTTTSDPGLASYLSRAAPPPPQTGEALSDWSPPEPYYAAGDVDGDGDLDLAVGLTGDSLAILLNDNGQLRAKASWQITEPLSFGALSFGDWDGDGDQDLAVALDDAPNRLYENEEGAFRLAWRSRESDRSSSVAWGDWDADGDLDLAVGNGQNEPNRLYENSGDTLHLGWTSQAADSTSDLAWGDWDGDGDDDLAVANLDGPSRVYSSVGGGPNLLWTSPVIDPTASILWSDWDGDGHLDLVVGNEGRNPERVYRNQKAQREAASDAAKAAIDTPDTAERHENKKDQDKEVISRLRFYPHWLIHSIFSPPLALALSLLALIWVLRVRTGMALLLCTALGQWAFLLVTVPPLDERFVISLSPVLVIAACLGWSQLPLRLRSTAQSIVVIIAVLTALDFHLLMGTEGSNNGGPDQWTRQQLTLQSASYSDGAWKRGEDERTLIREGSIYSWREARAFYEGIWSAVERCGASTVLIASEEGPIDDSDWWSYRVALAGVTDDLGQGARPAALVIRGGDAAKGNYLAEALQPTGIADLALSLPQETTPERPPLGIPPGTMEIVETLDAGDNTPAVHVWRRLGAGPCKRP